MRRVGLVRHPKVVDALVWGKWDALMEALSTFDDQAKKEDSFFWQLVLHKAMACKRYDVIEFLVRKRWPVPLDSLLRYAISFGKSGLEAVERLCWLGAGGITDYWGECNRLDGRVATYGILLEHNVVSPRTLLFCAEGDLDENETIPQQLSLAFLLDISGDRCGKRGSWFRKGWFVFKRVDDDDDENVAGLAELYARNGALVAVRPSLLEQLPQAGRKVSTLMAVALRPASLQSLCRKAVRQVGPKRKFKSWVVTELGLPRRLSDYLCSSEA